MNRQIQILDCTLRDGGFGLEDAKKNDISDIVFSLEDITGISRDLARSNIDIVELGAIELSDDDKSNMAIYQNIDSISSKIPENRSENQIYAALFRGPDTPIEDIPDWNPSYCEAIRVILRYSELRKSLEFCKALSEKNYKVFLQPMVTMRYTDEEIQLIIDAANDMKAYALYFVDSYGYMTDQDVNNLFSRYDKGLNSSIKIGFHAHNNINLAFSNAIAFLRQDSGRDIILDSCCLGMGQGAGNLQTEIIADYMNMNYGTSYDYDAILSACETVDKYLAPSLWGYSLTRFLPAINNTAYKFAISLREKYKLNFVDINRILKNIPEKYRHRYTEGNTVELLKLFGYDSLIK